MDNLPAVTFSATYSSRETAGLPRLGLGLFILFLFRLCDVFNAAEIDLLSAAVMQLASVVSRKQAAIPFVEPHSMGYFANPLLLRLGSRGLASTEPMGEIQLSA